MTRKELQIPKIVDDYNHYMGEVDIADQLRSYYNCQLITHHTWFPLFFWILDTTLVNCFFLYQNVSDTKMSSRDFRINLAWSLIQETLNDEVKKTTRSQSSNITFSNELSKKKKYCLRYKKF